MDRHPEPGCWQDKRTRPNVKTWINSNHEAMLCSWSHVYVHVWNHMFVTNCIPLICMQGYSVFQTLPSLFAPPLSPPTNYQMEGSGARLIIAMVRLRCHGSVQVAGNSPDPSLSPSTARLWGVPHILAKT